MAKEWRLASSLIKLRDQINTSYPNRSKISDGTIGDAAHAAQGNASDHNPNANGVVTAMDITNDPNNGVNVQAIADSIIAAQDSRVKYLVFNDHIMVPDDYGWKWVYHYEGSHRQHLHVSVYKHYDDQADWNIDNERSEEVIEDNEDEYTRAAFMVRMYNGGDLGRSDFSDNYVGNTWRWLMDALRGDRGHYRLHAADVGDLVLQGKFAPKADQPSQEKIDKAIKESKEAYEAALELEK